jgi:hypothetical protein
MENEGRRKIKKEGEWENEKRDETKKRRRDT